MQLIRDAYWLYLVDVDLFFETKTMVASSN